MLDEQLSYGHKNIKWAEYVARLRSGEIVFHYGFAAQADPRSMFPDTPAKRMLLPKYTCRRARAHSRYEMLMLNGMEQTAAEWAADIGITETALFLRIDRWGLERALTAPAMKRRKEQ